KGMCAVRRAPPPSTGASRRSASTTSTIWPGIARHIVPPPRGRDCLAIGQTAVVRWEEARHENAIAARGQRGGDPLEQQRVLKHPARQRDRARTAGLRSEFAPHLCCINNA